MSVDDDSVAVVAGSRTPPQRVTHKATNGDPVGFTSQTTEGEEPEGEAREKETELNSCQDNPTTEGHSLAELEPELEMSASIKDTLALAMTASEAADIKEEQHPQSRETEIDKEAKASAASEPDPDGVRVFKKVSANGKMTLYLINRDLIIDHENVSPLHAVVTVDDDELKNRKIYAQILLTFRYGRDDEEVMGLKLSNESVLCIEQIYPPLQPQLSPKPTNRCQEVLMRRLGPQAHLISMKLNRAVPASVRLLPAKEYRGAAIGINYDLRVYTAESLEEKPHRRGQVRMAIRLVQYAPAEVQRTVATTLRLEKHFLLREGAVQVEANLDRHWYTQGMPISVQLRINNRSSRIIKKIQIRAIQHVDVTMFSNGKFKNVIAMSEDGEGLPLAAGQTLERQYPLALLESTGGRHWVALEDRYGRLTATLASTTLKSAPNERHFFAIYITYYVKIRLVVSGVGGDITLKIPFVLMRDGPEENAGDSVPQFLDDHDKNEVQPTDEQNKPSDNKVGQPDEAKEATVAKPSTPSETLPQQAEHSAMNNKINSCSGP